MLGVGGTGVIVAAQKTITNFVKNANAWTANIRSVTGKNRARSLFGRATATAMTVRELVLGIRATRVYTQL